MTTIVESNSCSICHQHSAKFICVGCSTYFRSIHFKEHEQQLSIKFDDEIVKSHDELTNQIENLKVSNQLTSHLFAQIEQWKITTTDRIEKAAEKARHELTEFIEKQRIVKMKELEPITKEVCTRREENNFVESDIHRLRRQIIEIQQSLDPSMGKDTTKIIIIEDDKIDWNKLIHVQREQQDS